MARNGRPDTRRRIRTTSALAASGLLALLPRLSIAVGFETEEVCRLFVNNLSGVIGMDAAYSVPLAEGEGSLWLFGDTLLGTIGPDGTRHMDGFERNTALVTALEPERACTETVAFLPPGARARELVPTRRPFLRWDRFFWPLDGFTTEDGTTFLYFRKVRNSKEGLGFEGLRTELYRLERDAAGRPRVRKLADLWGRDGKDHVFGQGVYYDATERMVYTFGCKQTDILKDGRFSTCALARVSVGDIANLEAYRYYNRERGWIGDRRRASELFTNVVSEATVSWNRFLERYLIVHTESLSSNVVLRTAPALTGPWSEPIEVFRCQDPELDPEFGCYAGKEHHEWARNGDRVLFLTYASNAPTEVLLTSDRFYWPHLLRVTLGPSGAPEDQDRNP
jgi:hypothetical protein